MLINKAYKFRLYPDAFQKEIINKTKTKKINQKRKRK